MSTPVLYIVHCIDTEGPLDEKPEATVEQINKIFGLSLHPHADTLLEIQNGQIEFGAISDEIQKITSPQRLAYNRNWKDVDSMLDEAMSEDFRNEIIDDFGGGWVYSWHCVDHIGLSENPRHKAYGYGEIFQHYKNRASQNDEINWHFHPLSFTRNPLSGASSYLNSWDILSEILCRRVLDDTWFPVVNRPGFHTERADSHWFLEQWLPFDYANQRHNDDPTAQLDLQYGRFGDWSRAPDSWLGYRPDHNDYQNIGDCRRWIFRCLNVGTRLRLLEQSHVVQAFTEARKNGSAILSFADHDYRDIRPDVNKVRAMIAKAKHEFPDVSICFAGAEEAARKHLGFTNKDKLKMDLNIEDGRVIVKRIAGTVFGSQPFLAFKTAQGSYFHDNLDILEPGEIWSYVLDEQTFPVEALRTVGVGSAGKYGGFDVQTVNLS